jgi:hypothetical protein
MKSPKDIEHQITHTHIKLRPEMRRRILDEAFKAQDELISQTAGSPGSKWRFIMNSKITRYVAAAIILVAVLVAINRLGGTVDGTSVVWAQVVEQMNTHTRYKCRQRVVREQGPEMPAMKVYHLNLSLRRQEVEDGSIHVIDMRGEDAITLELKPVEKKAFLTRLRGMGPRKDPDIVDMVKRFELASTERLGTKEKGGKTLQGFRHAPNEHNDFTVWVDPVTKLPVEIELKHPTAKQTIFMDEFEFDFDLDESAFSTEIPAGYEVKTTVIDYRPFEPKVVTPEVLRSELGMPAYTLDTLSWIKNVTLMQITNPLMKRGKVFVMGMNTDTGNRIVIAQSSTSTEWRMVWLAQQAIVLETPSKRQVYSHPNGAIYAGTYLEAYAKVSPGFLDMKDLSDQRTALMVLMPNGVVLGISANQSLEEGRLAELVDSLKEIKTP